MKRNFLILMLLSLLPLAGWAASTDLTVKPSLATGLTYTGGDHPLLTGTVDFPANYDTGVGGVLFVAKATEADPTTEEIAAATSTFPKGKNAGKYYIYYKVLADGGDYTDAQDWQLLDGVIKYTRISQATPDFTAPEGKTGLFYNTNPQQLIQKAGNSGNAEQVMKYSVNNSTWYEAIDDNNLKQTNANTTGYTVYWKLDASTNYKGENGTFTVAIDKAATVIQAPEGKTGLVYTHSFYNLIKTPGSITTGDGTLQYSLDETHWYTSYTDNNLKKRYAQDYTMHYKVEETDNYKEASGSIVVNIAKRDISEDPDGLTYTATPDASVAYDGTQKTTTVTFTYNGAPGTFTQTYNGERTNVSQDGFNTIITGTGNFTGTKSWNTKITALDISSTVDVDASLGSNQEYTGSKIEPTTTGLISYNTEVLLEGNDKDYTVTYGNTNKDNKTVAKGGIIIINFKGNYKGTKSVEFAITKPVLTVTARDNEKFYGTADPTVEYDITGWKNGAEEVTGTPNFTRAAGEDKGTYTWAYSSGLTTANYTFTSAAAEDQGKLTIKSNTVDIQVANAEETYGYKLPTLDKNAFDYEAVGLGTLASIASMEFTVTDAEDKEYSAGDMLEQGTYTITAKNAVASPVSAAEFTYTVTGTLTIQKKDVVITTLDQDVDYTAEPQTIVGDNFADTYVTIKDTEGNDIDFNAIYGISDAKAYFINALTWEGEGTLKNPGKIGVDLTETYSSKNFNVSLEKGDIHFTGAATTLSIVRLAKAEYDNTNPVAAKLQEFDGVEQNVTISAKTAETIDAFRKIEADRWYAMVLPFNTDVRTISTAFGYAVVDIFDESSTLTDDVKFKLHVGEIEANKPFIVKTDKAIDLYANPLNFGDQIIVYSADPTAATKDGSAKFIGKYDGKNGFDDNDGHQYVFSLSTGKVSNTGEGTYIPSMSAYIWMQNQMSDMSKARSIVIEEADGSTTTISTVKADGTVDAEGWYNLNGVKQQSAPAQKGVYIQNGKKLVVK